MKRGAKAQAAMEYVMIAALVAIIIIPTTLIFYNYASDSASEIDQAQIDKFGRDVVNTAESVYYLGPPSRIVIEERLPENIESISIDRDSVTGTYLFAIAARGKSGLSNLTFTSGVRLEGNFDVEDRGAGSKKVKVSAERDAQSQPFVYIRFGDFGRAFVSSATYTGNILGEAQAITPGFAGDGLKAGDFLCQRLADAASLGGTWRAWLSSSTANANTKIADKSYKHINNTLVASNMADLTDGSIANPIRKTESGAILAPGQAVWTGTASNGQASAATCNDWTSNAVTGRTGLSDSAAASWTDSATSGCGSSFRIYCFDQ